MTILMNPKTEYRRHEVAPEHLVEIRRFEAEIEKLERGERDPDDFRKFRLENGVYGIRHSLDRHMIRIKIPFGALTPDAVRAMASVTEKYTPNRIAHVTTRQDVQIHYVPRRDVPRALLELAEGGLTTREACGNTVRNVTACPYAGISREEVFDVTPYADAVSRRLLRNPINQNLPRKFKIVFEGCPTDHARVPIHDLGFVAKLKDGKRGFAVYVGGGLGAQPFSAALLDPFMPEELLFPTTEAVLRLFDRHGNRANRNKARIKYLVHGWGIEEFRRRFLEERKVAELTRSGANDWAVRLEEERPPAALPAPTGVFLVTEDFERWRETNVLPQKQRGFFAVTIRCPLGDITVPQLRAVADLAERFSGGRLRTTITQNLVLRWVREEALPALYGELEAFDLHLHSAERVADITRCPGADTCQLAITHSRALASKVAEIFQNGYGADPLFQGITIKISGCFNSCGQHHIADIGYYGASKDVDGHETPHYVMLLGGGTREGKADFGEAVTKVPASRVGEATKSLLDMYREQRQGGESFHAFLGRMSKAKWTPVRDRLKPFSQIPTFDKAPEFYKDLGEEDLFKVELGKGECAS